MSNNIDNKPLANLYDDSMANLTDLYVIKSGPRAIHGTGIPLRFIEMDHDEQLDTYIDTSNLASYDPQPPELMTFEDLAKHALGHHAAVKQEKNRALREATPTQDLAQAA